MTYLSMYAGNDRELTITASEDLSGADVYWTARRRKRDTEPLLEKSTVAGISVNGAVATVALDREDTVDLDPVVAHWDVEVVDGSGDTHTVATGRLAIKRPITRRSGEGS
jgi:hypothetical protein